MEIFSLKKRNLIFIFILLTILLVLSFFREQQLSKTRAKAFETAIQKAKSLGYDVANMDISKEIVGEQILMVSFKSNKKNTIDDIEIYLHYDKDEIEILGVYAGVDTEKDVNKILTELLNKQWDKLSNTVKGAK